MGVKSLWTLLEPVGRPVPLETMEGKAMAIDSSIWIYQFQATMRDKEGRGLVNAHLVGFLRRITKLLFYGIKPVFVFDGGAPALKRATISERKNKKAGAAASHAKIAERLLAAQMRREAVNQIQAQSSKGKGKATTLDDQEVVYMEDLLNPALPKTPARGLAETNTSPQSSGKKRWRDHDPYRLPDVDMDHMVAQATRSNAPDPRLATEDELRAFIDEMKPEDFDVTSPAFRELPTEVQYEIIGDLRLRSRQTSYKRLQNMLRNAKTPLDFSKEQIKNLKQRNSLTQQLLTTTDSIGKAHVEIPIRIASERNRQYLLIKNEGEAGGWVLGIRDEGTRAKPIEIDQDPVKPSPPKPAQAPADGDDDDSDMEMEEVEIVAPSYDPDLREYRRSMALSALAERYSPKKLAPLTTKKVGRKPNSKPLFALDERDPDAAATLDDEDLQVIAAMQRSLEDTEEDDMQRAIEESTAIARQGSSFAGPSDMASSSSHSAFNTTASYSTPRRSSQTLPPVARDLDSDDDLYASPTRLETALSIANAGPSHTRPTTSPRNSMFGLPTLLVEPSQSPKSSFKSFPSPPSDIPKITPRVRPRPLSPPPPPPSEPVAFSPVVISSDEDDDDMEEVVALPTSAQSVNAESPILLDDVLPQIPSPIPSPIARPVPLDDAGFSALDATERTLAQEQPSPPQPIHDQPPPVDSDSDSDEHSTRWSRSPSPTIQAIPADDDNAQRPTDNDGGDWDAANEMDPHAEEGEYARFMSQVRGKDLESVRQEIDEEIQSLNQQRKVAMRDSEDITQQMISQIMMMLRLFGIPYITAPMEAEAQCAELLNLELVDGIITDDSDVFLFGGGRVFKNMFNQSKTVECFLSSDLERELGLERDKLIRLAYLLGSDYTEGLPGVGPVVAMELLAEFGGHDALHKFKDWWRRVQSGKDTATESNTKFRRRFKKRFKDLFLPEDWPNPAVRDAYYHPTVDSSEEPFKWGLPDLDALREFFNSELGWNQGKVDDQLLPIIQKMSKRTQQGAINKQGNLLGFFDVPAGGSAPRKRQAYSSKRLQQVVADFRKKQSANGGAAGSSGNASLAGSVSNSEGEDEERPKKRKKTAAKGKERAVAGARGTGKRGGRGRGRGRGRGSVGSKGGRKSSKKAEDGSESGDGSEAEDEFKESGRTGSPPPVLNVELRPRPKPRPIKRSQPPQEGSAEGEGDELEAN
ncbi:PIN domain-like protein [Cristinia sonorae]|uniref:PIN domain-like protein n=1 Tax=Cristinia sonorae TaxID=1940300 RepID=A0A8K0UI20_9AGAR|nr:PIN domain-like protein [Cristinia sonorae]